MRLIIFFISLLTCGLSGKAQTFVTAKEAQADLVQMVDWVKEVHYNPFLTVDSNTFNYMYQHSLKKIGSTDSISVEQLALIYMQLLSTINDGHTSIDMVSPSLVTRLLESTFYSEKLIFRENEQIQVVSGNDSGKVVASINGIDAIELYSEVLNCYGGNGSFRRQIVQNFFFPIYLHLRNIKSPYEVLYQDDTKTVLKEGLGIKELLRKINGSGQDYSFEVLDHNIGYLAYNSCNNAATFNKFLKSTFQEINDEKITQLIIDIRKNTGGNSYLNELLLAYVTKKEYRQSASRYWKISEPFKNQIDSSFYEKLWGKKFVRQYQEAPNQSILKEDEYTMVKPKAPRNYFDGEACLLIGPQTFSSANFLADAVSTYDIMPLIGRPTGENTNDFGEQISLTLPNSQLVLQVSIAYDIGADGDHNRVETVDPTMYTDEDALQFAIDWFSQPER